MTDDFELLRAVIEQPEQELPRLVFADWLEEQGGKEADARARYIRVQVEAERFPVGSAHRLELNRQAGELRDLFRDEWDRDPPVGYTGQTVVVRRRGFIDEIRTGIHTLLSFGDRMFAIAPIRILRIIDGPTVSAAPEDWLELGERPWLSRLRELQIGPYLTGWTELRRTDSANPVDGVGPVSGSALGFFTSRHLKNLIRLEFNRNAVDTDFVRRLLETVRNSVLINSLRELDLCENAIDDAGAAYLSATSITDRLLKLELAGNRISQEGARLLRSRYGSRVRL